MLLGGFFYTLWLAAFLIISYEDVLGEAIIWASASIITGIGFALGAVVFNRLLKLEGDNFLQVLKWSTTGCVVGALIVYWFGPMLIVFSMLLLGTQSMSIREVVNRKAKE